MSQMLLSMAIGTNVGLTAGVLFGSLFQGTLFYSTIYSVLVGVLAGTVCGIVFGIHSSLEGFMAGIMGGMMGAMLGEMITEEQSFIITNLFLTLLVSTLFLFPILAISSDDETQSQTKKWFFKPFITFILISTYLLIGSQVDKKVIFSESNLSSQEEHSTQHADLSQTESKQLELTINVKPSQFFYDPSNIKLEKDKPVSLIFKNNDSIEHDIEIKNIPIKTIVTGSHEGHSASEADFHLHAAAQKQSKITFTPLKTGTYEFYCTIPGHKENGMVGLLIVT